MCVGWWVGQGWGRTDSTDDDKGVKKTDDPIEVEKGGKTDDSNEMRQGGDYGP